MSAFKRKDRPNEGYRIRPSLPEPWGRVGPWQTGLRRKDQARDVERWIHEMALTKPELIDALQRGDFTLQAAWVAKLRGTVDELLAGVNDPTLEKAVEAFKPHCKDERARGALSQILKHAPAGARLSWLTGSNIRDVYLAAELEGQLPNSVRRGLHRAVSELLAFNITGEKAAERRAARFEGVVVPGEDDTREVRVTADDVRRLLDACEPPDFRWLVLAAIATAVDLKPLRSMTPRHVHEDEQMAAIPDTKNASRPRLIRLSDIALLAFRMAARGKEPHERLWAWTDSQVRTMWENARDTASGRASRLWQRSRKMELRGHTLPPDPVAEQAMQLLRDGGGVTLPIMRFKDLRHLLPTMLAELGYDRREIQAYIGHARGSKQTDRYITPSGDVSMLDGAAARLGLSGANLRAVGE